MLGSSQQKMDLNQGRFLPIDKEEGEYLLCDHQGDVFALGEVFEGILKVKRMLVDRLD